MADGTCSFSPCDKPRWSRGLCGTHYAQLRRGVKLYAVGVTTPKPPCSFNQCDNAARTHSESLCDAHYYQRRRGTPLRPLAKKGAWRGCSFDGCERQTKSLDLCAGHYRQQCKGRPLRPLTEGRRWDSVKAEGDFRREMETLGYVVIGEYVRAHGPIEAICPEGHRCKPRPRDILSGQGGCEECAGKNPTAVYVVQDPSTGNIKFGVTSNSGEQRMRDHERDGFDDRVRLYAGLPKGVALPLERGIKHALRDAGYEPVRGYEYFPEAALPVVLDLIDNHPAIAV